MAELRPIDCIRIGPIEPELDSWSGDRMQQRLAPVLYFHRQNEPGGFRAGAAPAGPALM